MDHLNHTSKIVVENADKVVAEVDKKKDLIDKINIEIQKKVLSERQNKNNWLSQIQISSAYF